jgi:murein DD-endopeptidase MepM/ murein hydrolase activator NlpD
MAKYKYNPETLQFEVVEISKTRKFFRYAITTIVTASVFCFILMLFSMYLVETPEQQQSKYTNRALEKQYKILLKRKIETDKVLRELQNRDKKIYRAVFEIDPVSDSADFQDPYQKFEQKNLTNLNDSNTHQLAFLREFLKKQRKESTDLIKMIKNDENVVNIPTLQPVQNADLHFTVYGYGNRIDPYYKTPTFHSGIDYGCPDGTNVYAAADGIVTNADQAKRGYGLQIRINHSGKYETVYAHLSETKVHEGQKVKRGDLIGLSGSSGKSYTPHLHYEILVNGKPVNPVSFFIIDLNPEEYREMFTLSSRGGLSLD